MKLLRHRGVFYEYGQLSLKTELTLAPDNVDMVVTFRNIHNWVKAGYADQVYAAAYLDLNVAKPEVSFE